MSGIVVMGSAGGCGVTTLACALALEQAAGATAPPLLVDLDPHHGGPITLWGLRAERRLDDLLALGEGITREHVEHLIHRHPSGVDLMGGCSSLRAAAAWGEAAAEVLAGHVAARGVWVADAGRGDTALARAFTVRAQAVVLVVPRSIEGVARAGSLVVDGDATGVTPVASDLPGGDAIAMRAVRRLLGREDVVAMPRDGRAAPDVRAGRAARGKGLARVVAHLLVPG